VCVGDLNGSLAFDEVSEDARGVAVLEPAELLSQQIIEGVGDDGEQDVEMDFEEYGR